MQMPPMPVMTEDVSKKDIAVFIETVGNVFSPEIVQVKPQVSGKLLAFHAKEGQSVKKGDLLFEIDSRPFLAALDRAKAMLDKDKAALEFAKARFDKHKDLVDKGYVSKLDMDEYFTAILANEAQVLIDMADIETAQVHLDHTRIYSPIDGVLGINKVDPGNCVCQLETPLIEIRQISPIDVRFTLSQNDFQAIHTHLIEGDIRFTFQLNGPVQVQREGEIYFVDHHLDTATGTILLKGEISNEDAALWPGEFGEVKLIVKTIPEALVVPETAILRGQKGKYVYVVKPDKTVEARQIKVGDKNDDYVHILEGLEYGENVVTAGQLMLRDGAPVSVIENKEVAGS